MLARVRQRAERAKGGEDKAGLPDLKVRGLVRVQDPKSGEWSMGRTVEGVMHKDRLVFLKFYKKGSRIFKWKHAKLDTSNEFTYGRRLRWSLRRPQVHEGEEEAGDKEEADFGGDNHKEEQEDQGLGECSLHTRRNREEGEGGHQGSICFDTSALSILLRFFLYSRPAPTRIHLVVAQLLEARGFRGQRRAG